MGIVVTQRDCEKLHGQETWRPRRGPNLFVSVKAYEDGSQRSTRRVPAEARPTPMVVRVVSSKTRPDRRGKSGIPPLAIKTIIRAA